MTKYKRLSPLRKVVMIIIIWLKPGITATFGTVSVIATICFVTMINIIGYSQTLTYPIAGTNQSKSYNDSLEIVTPAAGQPFYGQDALQLKNPIR